MASRPREKTRAAKPARRGHEFEPRPAVAHAQQERDAIHIAREHGREIGIRHRRIPARTILMRTTPHG